MSGLNLFNKTMGAKYETKSKLLGPDAGQTAEIRVLNRVLRWTKDGIQYEPDQRHAEIIVKAMGVQGSKAPPIPGSNGYKNVIEIR